jgi:hypothetical protein
MQPCVLVHVFNAFRPNIRKGKKRTALTKELSYLSIFDDFDNRISMFSRVKEIQAFGKCRNI